MLNNTTMRFHSHFVTMQPARNCKDVLYRSGVEKFGNHCFVLYMLTADLQSGKLYVIALK